MTRALLVCLIKQNLSTFEKNFPGCNFACYDRKCQKLSSTSHLHRKIVKGEIDPTNLFLCLREDMNRVL